MITKISYYNNIYFLHLLWLYYDQNWQKVKWERDGAGSGKVLELGFELGTPVAQKR